MNYNKYYIRLRQKLDHLIRSSSTDDYASISALIGKNHAYMQQFIKRGVPKCLKNDDLEKIVQHLCITMDYFGSPEDFPNQEMGATLPLAQQNFDDDYIQINVYDIDAAAGVGAVVEHSDVTNKFAFKRSWLRNSSNATADDLAVIRVSGDSMTPTLCDGDRILIDMTQKFISNEGIYVLWNDDMILVKRISLNPATKLCTIKSDNSFYESWEGCKPSELDILGRVIWMGRNI